MAYFTVPYKVLFHDTMAYGSHHHMTNIKFQNLVRETLFFGISIDGMNWEDQFADTLILTREAYSLNLAPVGIGEKVAILLTYEEPSRSSVRLCFRTVKEDGSPVSCGYQTMVLVNKDSLQLVPAPMIITKFLDTSKDWHLVESQHSPSFKELIHQSSGVKQIFSKEIISLGSHVANLPSKDAYPQIWNVNLNAFPIEINTKAKKDIGTPPLLNMLPNSEGNAPAFLFQGQGGYNKALAKNLMLNEVYFQHLAKITDQVCIKNFGASFTDFLNNGSSLEKMRDFDQFGIYLIAVTFGKKLMEAGIQPQLLVGHSFGEIAALALGGVFSFEEGIHIIAHRIKALQMHAKSGKMMAFATSKDFLEKMIAETHFTDLEITVVNGNTQTVLSGNEERLTIFGKLAKARGIKCTLLKSAYPFHSSLLSDSRKAFWNALDSIDFKESLIPIICGTKLDLYNKENTHQYLADQLTETLNFNQLTKLLYQKKYNHFIECGKGNTITNLIKNILPDTEPAEFHPVAEIPIHWKNSLQALIEQLNPNSNQPKESCVEEPIAIVGMGGVFPGAANPEEFWDNLMIGKSGIVDLAEEIEGYREDFMGGSVNGQINLVPEKTYTLLSGTIHTIDYLEALHAPYCDRKEFDGLLRLQKLLLTALAQSIQDSGEDLSKIDLDRVECIIGSTADGTHEYDVALVRDLVVGELDNVQMKNQKADIVDAFKMLFGNIPPYQEIQQNDLYKQVLENHMGIPMNHYVIDTACSSSLYSINLGIKSLIDGDKDLVLAGGAFAPGPANNTLFAQFRGLTPTESRPLDHKSDGVIFGDGSGILVLKRLSDAIKDNNKIHGVIRAMGLSSDGKSPGINVPQQKGQRKAIEFALDKYDISKRSIQYIETHATATPVGDAVEVNSLIQTFKDRDPSLPKIGLRSPKSLIGHTGWASGVHSVMKVLLSLKHKQIPKQSHFTTPNPSVKLEESPFHINKEHEEWKENIERLPRRSGVNSFGFGGTNAHIVIEEYVPEYHHSLSYPSQSDTDKSSELVVVLDAAFLYPGSEVLEQGEPGDIAKFDRSKLRLPKKKLLLPDVTDHMDPNQFLLALAAEKILNQHASLKENIKEAAVVSGLFGKSEKGMKACKRVFKDRIDRRVLASVSNLTQENKDVLLDKYLENTIPSGPYTLPGLMPNVAASRVSALFDMNGPNIVIDKGERSLLESLYVGAKLAQHGDAKVVFAGGAFTNEVTDARGKEGVCMLALTTKSNAEALGIQDYKILNTAALRKVEVPEGIHYKGIKGIIELQNAFNKRDKELSVRTVDAATYKVAQEKKTVHKANVPKTHRYVKDTPIINYLPKLTPAPPISGNYSIEGKTIVFVCDSKEVIQKLENAAFLKKDQYKIVHPFKEEKANENHLPIDLQNEASITQVCQHIASFAQIIILFKDLKVVSPEEMITDVNLTENFFFQAHFHSAKQLYDSLSDGSIKLFSTSHNSCENYLPHPYTGLIGGFIKSLQRELPNGIVRAIHTNNEDWFGLANAIAIEAIQPPTEAETFYIDGKRHLLALEPTHEFTTDHNTYLDENSVVIASGGGKGVTAVMAETLLNTFGCKVIALGRTRLEDVPQEYLDMSEEEFAAFETDFYRQAIASGNKNIKALKAQYQKYRSSNELSNTIKRLNKLPGAFEYYALDITIQAEVEALVKHVIQNHGKVDLLMHGAGVQYSGTLKKKEYTQFQKVVDVKVKSLIYFSNALKPYQSKSQVTHFHLLTSAFSYLGNDGQEDYGAANECMNRFAEYFNGKNHSVWTALAWLGWEGIGMTRGSEYAALAAIRKLRGVSRKEGGNIFKQLMAGTPAGASNIILTEGELDFYHPPISKTKVPSIKKQLEVVQPRVGDKKIIHQTITLNNAPFLYHHLVKGTPTVPGAFSMTLISDAAKEVYPDLFVATIDQIKLKRLIKVRENRPMDLRIQLNTISVNDAEVKLKIHILSDFKHASGLILEKDIVHFEAIIIMKKQLEVIGKMSLPIISNGVPIEDPFTMENKLVALSGSFKSIKKAIVGDKYALANYAFQKSESYNPEATYSKMLPSLTVLDASLRAASYKKTRSNMAGLYVPVECGNLTFGYDITDFDATFLADDEFDIVVDGAPVLKDNNMLHVGSIYLVNGKGEILIKVEGGICKKMGEIPVKSPENAI